MIFNLSMNLDNADADDGSPDAIADYLQNVTDKVRSGHGTGHIRDANGNSIGVFGIEDSGGELADEYSSYEE